MGAGLEIWADGDFEGGGIPKLSTAGRSGFILGRQVIGPGNATGSLSDSNLGYGDGFAVVVGTPIEGQPDVTVSSSAVNWTANDPAWTGTLFYGVY